MNIFRQFQIKKEIDRQAEIVQLGFERLETYYKKHIRRCVVPNCENIILEQLRPKSMPQNTLWNGTKYLLALQTLSFGNYGYRPSSLSKEEWHQLEVLRRFYSYKIVYDKGALEEFSKMNKEFVEDFNKLMRLFREASISTAHTQWETMSSRHSNMISDLNGHPKYENKV